MISGFDSVILSAGPAGPHIEEFFRRLARNWPSMRIADVDGGRFAAWHDAVSLPPDRAQILIAHDEEMVDRWDVEGYFLSAEGYGPLAVAYEPCPVPQFRVLALDNPYGAEGFLFEPYEAVLVGARLSLVTVVTPDEDSEFSRSIITELTSCLGERPSMSDHRGDH